MADELDERVRALDAERQRPGRQGPSVEELLTRLIHVIAAGLRMPPDKRS